MLKLLGKYLKYFIILSLIIFSSGCVILFKIVYFWMIIFWNYIIVEIYNYIVLKRLKNIIIKMVYWKCSGYSEKLIVF